MHLSRSCLCGLDRNAADLIEPQAALQKTLDLQTPVLWTYYTHVLVLGGEKPGSTKGRFWPYIGDSEHSYIVYDFTMSQASTTVRRRSSPTTKVSSR